MPPVVAGNFLTAAFVEHPAYFFNGLLQQSGVLIHVFALLCFFVKQIAKGFISLFVAGTHKAVNFQNLFCVGIIETDLPVIKNVNQEIRLQRVHFFIAICVAFLFEAIHHSGFYYFLFRIRKPCHVQELCVLA